MTTGHMNGLMNRLRRAAVSQDGPLAEAEAALRKLRANPNDKQAADALERALQRLKERAEPASHPGATRPNDQPRH
jgi:hypothetical protein